MFTGIVEHVARISRLEPVEGRIDLEIEVVPEICDELAIGDSLAIDGCCMTVTTLGEGRVTVQAIPETLRRTSLGERKPGDPVNLERAMRVDARLDGHLVQGHVDGTGRIRALERQGEDVLLRIDCADDLARQLVDKGSVTVDGVSLTLVEPDEQGFSVALIPHTLEATTLARRSAGDRVNLELDVLGKYVFRYLERHAAGH